MFGYDIVKSPDFEIDEKVIDNIFIAIHKIVLKEQKGVLNIVFLNKKSIQELNAQHRNIDKATDVLSFHYFDDFSIAQVEDIVGEIVLCEEKVKEQGEEYGLGVAGEFYKLLIHSVLHILGYDHEEDEDYLIMNDLEKQIGNSINIKV